MNFHLSDEDWARIDRKGSVVLEEGIAVYDDGTRQSIDIGKIIIKRYPEEDYSNDLGIYSSSGGNSSSSIRYSGEPARLTEVKSDMADELARMNLYAVDYNAYDSDDIAFKETFDEMILDSTYHKRITFGATTVNDGAYRACLEMTFQMVFTYSGCCDGFYSTN